jgi:hypothetical protein
LHFNLHHSNEVLDVSLCLHEVLLCCISARWVRPIDCMKWWIVTTCPRIVLSLNTGRRHMASHPTILLVS